VYLLTISAPVHLPTSQVELTKLIKVKEALSNHVFHSQADLGVRPVFKYTTEEAPAAVEVNRMSGTCAATFNYLVSPRRTTIQVIFFMCCTNHVVSITHLWMFIHSSQCSIKSLYQVLQLLKWQHTNTSEPLSINRVFFILEKYLLKNSISLATLCSKLTSNRVPHSIKEV
jgi:hypothetical protein